MIIEIGVAVAAAVVIYKIGVTKVSADVKAAIAKVEALVSPTPAAAPAAAAPAAAAPAATTASAVAAPVTASGIVATIKADLAKYL